MKLDARHKLAFTLGLMLAIGWALSRPLSS